jgi:tRNA nucleotidyltransferase/poly(A) polymerase
MGTHAIKSQVAFMKIPFRDLISSSQPGAYLVGGCVRDLIQGLTPRDFDIVVPDAPRAFAEETAKRLDGRVFVLGKDQFTVFCVASPEAQIDIMSYKGSNIKDDLHHRDFTINALAYRLSDGRLVDVTGGLQDLHRRMVRMISPRVFQDDPVRLVRAFRMAAALNFRIETETLETIKALADLLRRSAAERIWAELQRILACPDSYPYLSMMYDTNVLSTILPELIEYHPGPRTHHHRMDALNQALGAVRALEAILDHPEAFMPPAPAGFVQSLNEESRILLKMAALLQNIGKPYCRTVDAAGRLHYYGHAGRGSELARTIGRRLRMSNRHREWIATLVHRHQRPLFLFRAGQGRREPPPKAFGRFFRQCGAQAPHLLMLSLAGSMAGSYPNGAHPAAMTGFLVDMLTHYADKIDHRRRSAIINGQDIIRNFGLPPSPIIGTLLRRVEELYLAEVIQDREQALQWVAEQLD